MALCSRIPDLAAPMHALARSLRGCGLLDKRCRLCGALLNGFVNAGQHAHGLCSECGELLAPLHGGFCPFCGLMHKGADATKSRGFGEAVPCTLCLQRRDGFFSPLPWQGFCFYAPYAGLLRACILAYKLNGRLGLGGLLQELLLAGWRNNGTGLPVPDCIVPVPLHRHRLRQRGFNQSLELARPLARQLMRPLAAAALARVRPTVPQFRLEPSQRSRNIRGAFAAEAALVAGAQVLLVDDIMTTGATLEECAAVLRKAGARRVDVLVLARTGRS